MGKIYGSLEELIGHTPMVALPRMCEQHQTAAKVYAKMEMFNPGGSSKDRLAVKLLDDAEKAGLITRGKNVIVEPTSGNTGIGLVSVARAREYRGIVVMPEDVSEERKKLLDARGAVVELTSAEKGMAGAIERAKEILKEDPDAWMPDQFNNPSGPQAHYETTGPEIWEDMDGKIDVFVCGIGTGGTITGVGRYLKEKNPNIKIVGVEPKDSAVLNGGKPGPHMLQGIGAGFVPSILDMSIIDEVMDIDKYEAYLTCYDLTAAEGYLVGISGGAALQAANYVARREEMAGKNVVVLLPDSGERYLSTEMYDEGPEE